MTAYAWIGGTGNWKVATNWSPGSPAGPPKATGSATISATGPAYTVTINSADVAQSLTENCSSATVDDAGSLTLSGTFTLSAGTFILGPGGTLSGGATKLVGGTFTCDGGTLSGVTYDGTLDLSGSGASVNLASGTVVNNAAGTGAGTINDTGQGSSLSFDNTQTFNNATINLGNASSYSYLSESDSTGAGTVLTLGSNTTIDESGAAVIETGNGSGDGIVNRGAIKQSGASSYLQINGNGSLTNSGTITAASSSGALIIDDATFANSGTLAISNGDEVVIAATLSNTGSITLASGASLVLDTTFTLAGLGNVSNSGGAIYIEGTLDNAGSTLNGSSGLGQAVLYGGTVQGGAATPSGLILSGYGGTLSGVTYDGTLDLSNACVHLADGTVINNAAGDGAGTINDNCGTLIFDNTQTFNNATINLAGALYEDDTTGAGTVLTLGSGVAIDQTGDAYIYTGDYSSDGIVSQGSINRSGTSSYLFVYGNGCLTNTGAITAASSGGALIIDTTTFTNSGTLDVSDGDTVMIESATFTNLPAQTLTGGTYEAEAGSTLEVDGADTITTDDADIILSGAGSTIETYNPSTGVTNTIDTTLCTIGASGELQLLASRNWTTAGVAIANDGLIQLGGGALTSTASGASLTNAAGSKLSGFGTVTATTFINSGTIEASGGTLTLTDAVSGTGGLQIDAGANLALAATAATTNTATFNGQGATLTLDHVGNLSGAIGSVGLDDTLDLVGVTANGATVNGSNQLVVTDNGVTVDTLQLGGNKSGFYFLPVSVSGGTDIVSLPIPATVADYLAVQSLYDQISGGFAISDTAANVLASFNSVNDPHINSITVSDTAADVAAHVGALNADSRVTFITISDTAANVAANLDALNDSSHVMAIALTDNGVPALTLSVAQALGDTTALGDITTRYTVTISDTAADVAASLDALNGDSQVTSIELTDAGIPTLTLTSAQYANDTKALGEITTPYAIAISGIAATAAVISANLNSYEASLPSSITVTDNQPLTIAVRQITSDAAALARTSNANGSAYALAVKDSTANVSDAFGALDDDSHVTSIVLTDSGTPALTLSATQALGDTKALGEITTAHTITISDAAADVAANLNALNADTNVTSIALTDGGTPTLTLSIQEALNDTRALSEITSPHTTALADTAADIELLSSTQAGALKTDGYTSVASTTGPVAMSIAEAETLSGDGIAVTGAPVTASGTVAAMTALATTEASTLVGQGAILAVLDTAADIQNLTTTEIAALSARKVTEINASDTSVSLSPLQAGAVEAAGVKVSAPPGDTVLISGAAANLEALTAGEIGGLPAIGVTGLVSIDANVSYTPAQTAAILANRLNVSAAGSCTVTENFANGGYSVYQGGQLIQQKSVNPDGSYDIAYFDVTGQTYSSYEDIYNVAGTLVADAQDNTDGSGSLLLYTSGLTITSASGSDSVTTGSDTFAINPHSTETIAGFVVGDTVDLTDLPYAPSDSSYSVAPGSGSDNYLATFDEGTSSCSLQFNQATPVTRTEFVLYEDGDGDTEVTRPIANNGVTALLQVGNHYELEAVKTRTGPLIELSGSPVTAGQFPTGWTPVGARWTGDGYEVAWSVPGAQEYVVWNTDSNGDYTSAATGVLSGTSATLEAMEATFGDGTFAGAGPPASTTQIGTNGELDQVGNLFELNPAGGGPLLELNGSPVTSTQFPAHWIPVGAMKTGKGYEVAFGNGANEYVVWNTDTNGDYTSAATGILSGTSYALEELEVTFGEDLNGDGTVGPTMAAIATNSTTILTEVANQFELNPAGGGTGPFLALNGSPVTAGQFQAGWTPVGAIQTGDGYEIAFSAPVSGQSGANEYVVWNTDGNGDFTSAATGILSGTSPALEAIEANFGETFPGGNLAGAVPPASTTMIATNGITTLTQVGNLFELNPARGGTGPLLELNDSVVTASGFPAGWTPVGAEQTANGYEVAWSVPGKNEYAVWNTDKNGNFTSGQTGVAPGDPAALWTINTNGATSLVQVGNHYELEAVSTGTGPLIELNSSAVTAGQFQAGWTPVGAEQTANGYEVAWSIPGANEFVVWSTDGKGDYISSATGILSGTSSALEAMEANFGETFPGAGPAASPGTPASTTVTGTNAATTPEIGSPISNYQTVDFADLPAGSPNAVDLIDPSGFLGEIENFASSDTINLSGDWVFLRFSENPAATVGTLTLENVASHADLSLKFVGDYAASNFTITPGMATTTIAHT